MADYVLEKFEWRGPQVKGAMERAIPKAMDDTTAAASIRAKQNHPGWRNRTGIAEGSIRGEPARRAPEGWLALFGSFGVDYFIWLEIGARGRAGDHTIGRAADVEFPKLPGRVREHLARESA